MPIQRPTWIEQMVNDPALRHSFFATCDKLIESAQLDVEKAIRASAWEKAAEALGKKEGINSVKDQIVMQLREDQANVEHHAKMEGETNERQG